MRTGIYPISFRMHSICIRFEFRRKMIRGREMEITELLKYSIVSFFTGADSYSKTAWESNMSEGGDGEVYGVLRFMQFQIKSYRGKEWHFKCMYV